MHVPTITFLNATTPFTLSAFSIRNQCKMAHVVVKLSVFLFIIFAFDSDRCFSDVTKCDLIKEDYIDKRNKPVLLKNVSPELGSKLDNMFDIVLFEKHT